jgi:hypothetical protein
MMNGVRRIARADRALEPAEGWAARVDNLLAQAESLQTNIESRLSARTHAHNTGSLTCRRCENAIGGLEHDRRTVVNIARELRSLLKSAPASDKEVALGS